MALSHHLKQGMPSTVSELELLVRKILEPITKALPSTRYLDQKINELNNQLEEQISKQNETIKVLSDRVDNLQSEIHKLKMPVKSKSGILTIWNNMRGENA